MVKFKKTLLDKVAFEAASVFDVNNDGKPDIVCGGNWYEAPGWKKHKICDVMPSGEYFDDFSDIPMDVNGDGFLDIVTGGWFGQAMYWRENPKGKPVEWAVREIDKCGNIETTRPFDIDKDGTQEIIPNTPGAPQIVYKLIVEKNGKGSGRFEKFTLMDRPSGHGLGFGDINGDGRPDIVLSGGWLENPPEGLRGKWTFHEEFNLGSASVPVLVYDVNGDGLADLIVGQAHGIGLYWYEQRMYQNGKKRCWIMHEIDTTLSQFHDMQMADIDNDGKPELITGTRYRAHCGNDPGEDTDIVGLYYFKISKGRFEKNVIDYGKVPGASGTGIYFAVADINGDGRPDIIAPGKEGLFLFENLG
ncbi:hypothetical protein COY52_08980 [Candidatus Desantisbacteria bacterium CG_4_10_14_0_8_um_filter_48_22]|uniref:VCBS repeat-containing protein n=1 Tax=Candidatus Desantisbacteria bacterium CG_4_10_14_0_8_um_filter_48_22 TaxID=1974543 RepID=A0A2M7S8R8_9BACT|nr:MAG: hypothetical protein COS16_03690 [Candidatus Desantisbacteria bacterium CG02_land_8_20_14_3_00_49_13]PIZ15723.1 MAG: hypothetical protein COY52_08980 [Candidatus Desantisbacteria bacterium CG_4_10_14_0_8_um_filter_48_22]